MLKTLTIDEAAEVFHVTTRTIRRWIETGKLPAAKVGRRHLISELVAKEMLGVRTSLELEAPMESRFTARAEYASRGMISAIFDEWFKNKGYTELEAFDLSIEIVSKLVELEKRGFLVLLRHDAACHHCGKRWPREAGEFHVTLCAECKKARAEAIGEEDDREQPKTKSSATL